ncbi:hypothetical protein [Sphingomonas sp. CFBP 13720]|uniref:hypothetical protein n=1 Tax=Sphingomonas sp. CFBP 13720 TaxID=2775302 RepID=UPI00177EE98A|nr:hypothetical protein [Sphingomonas sp. CFBP 13720]MBD8677560.1 hypothetical protein [Sphingomonas sp. CFBP 13720]
MVAKLRVSLSEGMFEAEGDDAFIKEMHSEFREYVGKFFGGAVSSSADARPAAPPLAAAQDETSSNDAEVDAEPQEADDQLSKGRRSPPRRRRAANPIEGAASKKAKYEPRVDPDLKLPGLVEAFDLYALKGHQETVLFFGHYLAHDAGINPFTADQIFTCYRIVKVKPPKAFAQALYDTRAKRHFIKFEKLDAISITHIGDTHYEHDLKKKD